ncbi:MAG: hypothetical protein ACR2RB_05200, partial [Gammaproteobacteria bacterium]
MGDAKRVGRVGAGAQKLDSFNNYWRRISWRERISGCLTMQLINHQKVVKHALVLFLLTLSAQAVSSGVDLETIMAKGCLESYTKKYLPKRQHKAFAYARDSEGKERCGWGYASSSVGDAKKTALRHCAKNKIASECRIIDVDGIVKIKEGDFKKLVSPDDRQLSDTELDVFWDEAVDMLEGRCIASFRKYLSLQGYKAFAYTVDDRGLYAFCVRASRAVPGTAEKAALEECNKRRNKKYPPPCKL